VAEEQEQEEPSLPPLEFQLQALNWVAEAVWIALVVFATGFAPGVANSDVDTAMFTTLVSQPFLRPDGINQLWFLIWNFFTAVVAVLAALKAPKLGQNRRLPVTPLSVGVRFFGPYFATRSYNTNDTDNDNNTTTTTTDAMGWASRNLFDESRRRTHRFDRGRKRRFDTSKPQTAAISNKKPQAPAFLFEQQQ